MTVQELIAKLEALPREARVAVCDLGEEQIRAATGTVEVVHWQYAGAWEDIVVIDGELGLPAYS